MDNGHRYAYIDPEDLRLGDRMLWSVDSQGRRRRGGTTEAATVVALGGAGLGQNVTVEWDNRRGWSGLLYYGDPVAVLLPRPHEWLPEPEQ